MSLKKIIDLDLLGRFLDKVKELIPTKVSDLDNDARYMSGMTILSYGKSTWADFMEAYGDNKVVYCRASSGSNPASGSQTRMAFMAYVNNQTTPTEVEFQYYRSVNAHTDAQQGDQVYVYKLNKTNGWSVIVRNSFSKLVTGTGLTHTYSNGTITIENSEIVPGVVSTTANGLAPQLPDESTATKFLRQDATWAVPEYPVTSVNGSTGAVTVDVPSKTSDLQNDSGFITGITSADVTTALGYTPPRQDTTYESKDAASGGTDVSLVTTGEKYTWNIKGIPAGGYTKDVLVKSSNTDYAAEWATLYSSATPNMDGTGSAGISSTFSRSDHVHPKDITKQDQIIASGVLKSDGSGGVSAAVAGTDYISPETNYSPWSVHDGVSSYAIVAGDANKTIRVNQSGCVISLTQAVSTAMPVGTEIAMICASNSDSAYMRLLLPSGRAYGEEDAFMKAKLNGCWGMYAIKKAWSSTADVWIVSGPDVENADASIAVSYPTGSSCTATNGSTILQAPDTSGSWVCIVPTAGTWTITATDGSDTSTATVTITSEGQREVVALSYTVDFVRDGELILTPTFDHASAATSGNYVGFSNIGNYYCFAAFGPIDLTGKSEIVIDVGQSSTYSNSSMVPSIGVSETLPTLTQSSGNLAPYSGYQRFISTASTGGQTIPEGQYVCGTYSLSSGYVWLLWSGQSSTTYTVYVRNFYVR